MDGDLTVDGGNIIGAAATNLLNASTTVNLGSTDIARAINIGTGTDVDTIKIGTGATGADVIEIGGGAGTLAINTGDWGIGTTGDMTAIGAITADGAIAFTPGSTSDVVFNLDADSDFQLDSTVANADTIIFNLNCD